jgi:hypothetical protein
MAMPVPSAVGHVTAAAKSHHEKKNRSKNQQRE